MNWKHLFWIVPIVFIIGLCLGFTSKVYINIPEKVQIEMGYNPETIKFLEYTFECEGLNKSQVPSPEVLNITIKEAENIQNVYGIT